MRSPVTALIERFLPSLRYPYLFVALAALLLVDLIVPDPIPLVDEVLLAMLTFLVGTWRDRPEPEHPIRDVTPADPELPADSSTERAED